MVWIRTYILFETNITEGVFIYPVTPSGERGRPTMGVTTLKIKNEWTVKYGRNCIAKEGGSETI